MKKLLFMLVLAVLGFAARAQTITVSNTYTCAVQVTFIAKTPGTSCATVATSNPVTIPAGATVPVNLGNPLLWGGAPPPPGSAFGAQICVVCSATSTTPVVCVGVVGCPPCYTPHLGPVPVPTSCCQSTVPLQADWLCTSTALKLNIHP